MEKKYVGDKEVLLFKVLIISLLSLGWSALALAGNMIH
jgi:hypothetical protein